MFHAEYDEVRNIIARAQSQILMLVPAINGTNPNNGGPGMTPEQTHEAIGSLAAEVHNVAFALGNLIDILDQKPDVTQTQS